MRETPEMGVFQQPARFLMTIWGALYQDHGKVSVCFCNKSILLNLSHSVLLYSWTRNFITYETNHVTAEGLVLSASKGYFLRTGSFTRDSQGISRMLAERHLGSPTNYEGRVLNPCLLHSCGADLRSTKRLWCGPYGAQKELVFPISPTAPTNSFRYSGKWVT